MRDEVYLRGVIARKRAKMERRLAALQAELESTKHPAVQQVIRDQIARLTREHAATRS